MVALAGMLVGVLVIAIPGDAGSPSITSFYLKCMEPWENYPAEKREVFEHECHVREEASRDMTPAKMRAEEEALHATRAARFAAAAAQEAAEPQPERITGLQQGPGGPPGTNMVFTSTGDWIGEVNGQWYQIYAGAKATPGSGQTVRSELLIYLGPKNINTTEREHQIGTAVPPEGGTRPLKITAASGSVLTIETATGSTLKFNVATQAFES
jgi:hypothetical protein